MLYPNPIEVKMKPLTSLVVLLCTISLNCTQKDATILGRLFNTAGDPITAEITLSIPVTKVKKEDWVPQGFQPVLQTVKTSADGSYAFTVDSTGIYVLSASLSNHVTQDVLLWVPESKNDIEIDFYLAPGDSTEEGSAVSKPSVVFKDEGTETAQFFSFARQIEHNRLEYVRQLKEVEKKGARDAELAAFTKQYDWEAYHQSARQVLEGTASTEFKRAALVYYLYETFELADMKSAYIDRDLAKRALALVPATSPLWSTWPDAFVGLHWANFLEGIEGFEIYSDDLLSNHPEDRLKPGILSYEMMLAWFGQNEAKRLRLFQRLLNEYPDSKEASEAKEQFKETRVIKPGNQVPDFQIVSFDEPETVYSRDALIGRVYIVDFWGTWCKPCIAEMPYLHAAYEKYLAQGFTILSIACDNDPENVREFRRTRWEMPWMHSYISECNDGNRNAKILKIFEVTHFPTSILVGADGKIIATTVDLREERLEENLRRVMTVSRNDKR